MNFNPSRDFARQLDTQDELASFRSQFVITNPDLIYLDGNSLGRLPKAAAERVSAAVAEWGSDLIRGWNKRWWDSPTRVGEKIARLVGAGPGQVIVSDSTSVNLYKTVMAAMALHPQRGRIVTDALNFPSDLYVLQGVIRQLSPSTLHGKSRAWGRHQIVRIESQDGDVSPDLDALASAVDENTSLVTLSHVTFKSGYLYEMAAITEMAHRKGALVLWDLCHSVGALPIQLDRCNADFAIGCTYKYLNGGPGSPAFLYVRRDLQDQAISPIWGWWGQKSPFAFDLDYTPAPGVKRFLAGSQPILSMLALEAALDPLLEAGMDRIRCKSVLLTEYLIYLADTLLAPHGFTLGSPRTPDRRGSHISLRHPEGYRINRALIDEMNVIPDFREPDNIRLGLAPLYTTFGEVWECMDRMRRVVEDRRFEKYPKERLTVT
jgi:kynureninase